MGLIDELCDRILWDADYEGDDWYMDDDPAVFEFLKTMTRIDNEYFMDIAPEPNRVD